LIFFDRSRAEVPESAQETVDAVAEKFRSTGAKAIRIEGHTDPEPVEAKNGALSQARAEAVRAALLARGVPAAAVTTTAAGPSSPMALPPDGGPEPQNRRVEITLTYDAADDFNIFFDRSTAELPSSALAIINLVAEEYRSTGAKGVDVEGHIDADPAEAERGGLAQARADAVRTALIAKGVPAAAITTVVAGRSRPLVPPDGQPQPQNRRVVVTLSR
jgi:outer membrane protein OmpA-like peptidoglycan-associated protein